MFDGADRITSTQLLQRQHSSSDDLAREDSSASASTSTSASTSASRGTKTATTTPRATTYAIFPTLVSCYRCCCCVPLPYPRCYNDDDDNDNNSFTVNNATGVVAFLLFLSCIDGHIFKKMDTTNTTTFATTSPYTNNILNKTNSRTMSTAHLTLESKHTSTKTSQ